MTWINVECPTLKESGNQEAYDTAENLAEGICDILQDMDIGYTDDIKWGYGSVDFFCYAENVDVGLDVIKRKADEMGVGVMMCRG